MIAGMGKILTEVLIPLVLALFAAAFLLYVVASFWWTVWGFLRVPLRHRPRGSWKALLRRGSGILPVLLVLLLFQFFTARGTLWAVWGAPRATEWALDSLPVSYQVQEQGGELMADCWPTSYVWYVALKVDAYQMADSPDRAVGDSLNRVVYLAKLRGATFLHVDLVDGNGYVRMGFVLSQRQIDVFLSSEVVSIAALQAWERENFQHVYMKAGLGVRTSMQLDGLTYGWNQLRKLWGNPCGNLADWQRLWVLYWDGAIGAYEQELARLDRVIHDSRPPGPSGQVAP